MSRIAEGLAMKGSQKWLQRFVNEAPEMLNAQLKSQFKIPKSESITILSPSATDDFAEYRPGLSRPSRHTTLQGFLAGFLAQQGTPVGRPCQISFGKMYLIEAKAHIPEINSPGTAAGTKSLARILESLNRSKAYLGVWAERVCSISIKRAAMPAACIHLHAWPGMPKEFP